MQQITYRPIAPHEIRGVIEVIEQGFHEYVAPGYSQEGVNTFLEYIRAEQFDIRHRDNHFTLAAADSDKIVGTIHIRNNEHISLLFVRKEYHRKGIARNLIAIAEGICGTNCPEFRELTVNSSPYAVSAYSALGFRRTGDETTLNGISFVPMRKNLG